MATARARLGLIALAALWLPGLPAHADDLAAAVKATYLYKLAPFVTWPPAESPGPDAPFILCLQAPSDFAVLVERVVAGQELDGHPIVVRRVAKFGTTVRCHIAFVGGAPGQTPAQALSALDGASVLTVTDQSRGDARGIVHLVLDQGRVRLAIDAGKARTAHLEISSKLLALATGVTR